MQLKGILRVVVLFIITTGMASKMLYANQEVHSVGPDGSFNYKVDIEIPPGRKGVQPKLALNYNSSGGNGMLGIGWQLSGLPAISRDPSHPIKYDGNDHYIGPNGRLVKIEGSTNLYQHENENYSLFKAVSNQGDGPLYWIEYRPDGTEVVYGDTDAARAEAYDNSGNIKGIRKWGIRTVEDLKGNFYTINYYENGGEIYPKNIIYTRYHGTSIFNAVEFKYIFKDNKFQIKSFKQGALVENNYLLSKIITKIGVEDVNADELDGTMIKTYSLEYEPDSVAQVYTLKSVNKQSGIFNEKVDLAWHKGGDDITGGTFAPSITFNTLINKRVDMSRIKFGDFNGDGKIDIYIVDGWGDTKQDNIFLSNGDTTFKCINGISTYVSSTEGWSSVDVSRIKFGDFNGDGKTDIYYIYGGYLGTTQDEIFLSRGNGYYDRMEGLNTSVGDSIEQANNNISRIKFGDFNGDGKTDIYVIDGWGETKQDTVFLSNGSTFDAVNGISTHVRNSYAAASIDISRINFGDFNGDGKTDIYYIYGGYLGTNQDMIFLSRGNGYYDSIKGINSSVNSDIDYESIDISRIKFGDFNGDGKTDIYYVNGWGSSDQDIIYLSTGTSTYKQINGISSYVGNHSITYDINNRKIILNKGRPELDISRVQFGDFNGDGKTDIYLVNGGAGYGGTDMDIIYLSYGNGFLEGATAFVSPISDTIVNGNNDIARINFGDFNGDGKSDIYYIKGWEGAAEDYILWNKIKPCLLKEISDSFGKKIEIRYQTKSRLANTINEEVTTYPIIANKSPRNLVTGITVSDGRGNQYTTGYQYEDAKTYMGLPYERKDLYFKTITETDSTGEKKITTYNQTKDLSGRPLKIEEYAGNGSLMAAQDFTYEVKSLNSGKTTWVGIESFSKSHYEMGSFLARQVVENQYDDYGNISLSTKRLLNSAGADIESPVISTMTYVYNTDPDIWIVNRLTEAKVTSGTNTLKWTRLYYTNNNLSRKEEWCDKLSTSGTALWIGEDFTYDTYGNVKTKTDALGNTTEYVYDDTYHTHVTQITNPLGQSVTREYDYRFGKITRITDPNGNVTEKKYDDLGRITEEIRPGDDWTKRYYYNDFGNASLQNVEVHTRDDSDNGYTSQKNYFDGLKRNYKIVTDGWLGKVYTIYQDYDAADRVTRETKPFVEGEELSDDILYTYDSAGRMIKKVSPHIDGTTITDEYIYSANGTNRQVVHKDAKNNSYINLFNIDKKLVYKEDPEGGKLTYTYTEDGKKLTSVTNGEGHVTSMVYNTMGKKISMTDPNTGTINYTFDANGNMTGLADANGNVRTFTYDALNRQTGENNPNGTDDVLYVYDITTQANCIGRLGKVIVYRNNDQNDEVTASVYSYTAKGEKATALVTIDGKSYSFMFGYNTLGKMNHLQYPDNEIIEKEYSSYGVLKSVKKDSKYLVQYGRVSGGDSIEYQIKRRTGNGVETVVEFDKATRLPLNIRTFKGDDVNANYLENVDYAYDNLNNVTGITDKRRDAGDNLINADTETFTYDGVNRLTSANSAINQYSDRFFAYDSKGNLTNKGGLMLNYADASHPQAVTSITGDVNKTYAYDANGNMTSRDGKTYQYNAKNQLIAIYDGATKLEEYTYNHAGMRIKKWNSDGVVSYSIAGLYEELLVPSALAKHVKYVHGVKGDLAAQLTRNGDILSAVNTYSVLKEQYAANSLAGLVLKAGASFNYYLNHKAARFYFMLVISLMVAALALFIFFRFFKEWKNSLDTGHIFSKSFAPILLLVVVFTLGFGACFDSTNGSEWEYGGGTEGAKYFHPNHVGSVKLITDGAGNLVSRMVYTPFGEVVEDKSTGTDISKYKYTGQEHDKSTKLHYYKARFYDPEIGRFICADTEIPGADNTQAFNRYSYVVNNPLKYIDQSGNFFGNLIGAIKKKLFKECEERVVEAYAEKIKRPAQVTWAVLQIVGTAAIIYCAGLSLVTLSFTPIGYVLIGLLIYQMVLNVGVGMHYQGKTGDWKGAFAIMSPTGLFYDPDAKDEKKWYKKLWKHTSKFGKSIIGHRLSGFFMDSQRNDYPGSNHLSLLEALCEGKFNSVAHYGYEKEIRSHYDEKTNPDPSKDDLQWYNYRDAASYI